MEKVCRGSENPDLSHFCFKMGDGRDKWASPTSVGHMITAPPMIYPVDVY